MRRQKDNKTKRPAEKCEPINRVFAREYVYVCTMHNVRIRRVLFLHCVRLFLFATNLRYFSTIRCVLKKYRIGLCLSLAIQQMSKYKNE